MLLVLEVEPLERIAFRLTGDRIDAGLRLRAVETDRTELTLAVSGPWLIGLNRRYPQQRARPPVRALPACGGGAVRPAAPLTIRGDATRWRGSHGLWGRRRHL